MLASVMMLWLSNAYYAESDIVEGTTLSTQTKGLRFSDRTWFDVHFSAGLFSTTCSAATHVESG